MNERLTASTAAMENHWQVDCASTLHTLTVPIALVPANAHAVLAASLEKCRYIYQPPGDVTADDCRDYAALLQAWNTADDDALTTALKSSRDCLSTLELE